MLLEAPGHQGSNKRNMNRNLVKILNCYKTVFFDDKQTASFAKIILPLSVLGTFSLYAYHFFVLGDPKVRLFNATVFEAPLCSTTFALIVLGFYFKNSETPKLYVFLPVTLVIIISIYFSGTRGVFLAQVVSVSAGILIYGFLNSDNGARVFWLL